MEKLLHERLREIKGNDYYNLFEFEDGYYIWMPESESKHLADEIEREYIPKPFADDTYEQIKEDNKLSEEEYKKKYHTSMDQELHILYRTIFIMQEEDKKVLDADGVEIKVGDTVWVIGGADDGKKLTVKGFEHCDSGEVYVSCGEKSVVNILRRPSDLTHKEPDSLEKLRDDMQSKLSMWHNAVEESTVEAWADRLSALIERCA